MEIITDLHLNYLVKEKRDNLKDYLVKEKRDNFKGDILIICGDIGNPYETYYYEFLSEVSKNFNIVFLVNGNHEMRYNNYKDSIIQLENLCNLFDNVIYLNQTSYVYKNMLFIGCPLWCNVKNNLIHYIDGINDYKKIIFEFNYMRPIHTNMLHENNKKWLKKEVENCNYKECFIITHFPPIRYTFKGNGLEDYYNNDDLKDINFLDSCNYTWCFGHTHDTYYNKKDNLTLINAFNNKYM